ncbi:hypothetical protein ADIS_4796 [Lunatimonas lonarensis]|uniref:Uncharacterized protein n=1 Tax=Lunatimonas lonarensis TaxID=1232681 RepID=R7ZKR6_9BACT|nr:hypothetical protein [Lunatimonas lonarensis]EON74685.1 hypothetical protein ADIS_4796 [Lunatimonas lonarensis]
MISWINGLFALLAVILLATVSGEDIRYFRSATLTQEEGTVAVSVAINDSLSRQEFRRDGLSQITPLNYSMDLHTGICFDNKCRPLKIVVYWNITGRYLGFELLDGEYLSKYDHEPFTEAEYEQLHAFLADPFLPLGNYSFEELVKVPDTGSDEVDGVSGATSKEVLQYVVEGAAYTTHKLWNIVHGETREQISALTEAVMDSHLFAKILESPDPSDQTWAAERVAQLQKMDGEALAAVVRLLREGDYFQGYLLLRSLSRDQLASDSLQLELFNLIGAVGSNLETAVIDRLSEVSHLNPAVLDHSFGMIGGLGGQQVIRLLKLYDRHDVRNPRLYEALKGLLPHENAFVGRQIAQFLER